MTEHKDLGITTSLTVMPMQWADLNEIDVVEPLNENDYACLAEVREVLTRHNKRDRFGVALLHKHFEVADDEVLMERSNHKDRVLTITPGKREDARNIIETVWRLQDGLQNEMLKPQQVCVPPSFYDSRHHQG